MSRNAETTVPRPSAAARRSLIAIVLASATLLGACADLYYDRRETVSFHAGDAVASNTIVQTVDPWPRSAGDRDVPANGQRMQAAVERYRNNRVTPLVTTSTSSVHYQPATQGSNAPAAAAGGTTP